MKGREEKEKGKRKWEEWWRKKEIKIEKEKAGGSRRILGGC